MAEENYEQVYEQLMELTKEQQRDYLTKNYQKVIRLTKENDPNFK